MTFNSHASIALQPKPSYEVWQAHLEDTKDEPKFQKARLLLSETKYKIPVHELKPGNYLFKVRIYNVNGGKYPSSFSENAELYIPSGECSI